MKSFAYASLFAGVALAAPVAQTLTPGASTNDLVKGACKPVTLIYARGSTEGGNMGIVVGPQFADALGKSIGAGQVAIQGVDYPADIAGAVTGAIGAVGAAGSKKMAELAKGAFSSCPTSKLVLSGYSQGAEQVHGALSILGADAKKIAAVVTFGDPMKMMPFNGVDAAKTKTYCNDGDPVCLGGVNILGHMSYGMSSATPAAQWVKSAIGSTAAPSAGDAAAAPAASAAPAAGGLGGLFAGLGGTPAAPAASAASAAAAAPVAAAAAPAAGGLAGMLAGLRGGAAPAGAAPAAASASPSAAAPGGLFGGFKFFGQ